MGALGLPTALLTYNTMTRLRHSLTGLLLAVGCALSARAAEINNWPGEVSEVDARGRIISRTAAGPFLFEQGASDGGKTSGFRPFYVQHTDSLGALKEITVLYPLFYYRNYEDTYEWSIFKLINHSGNTAAIPAERGGKYETFDVWPFYFSRQNNNPETDYRALLPIAGTIKNRFGYDELNWTLLPFYGQAKKGGWTTTATPWPFIRTTRGTETGFAFWPLFGIRDKPGAFHQEYYLWPLVWNNTTQPHPDDPAGTPITRQVGVLPFYTLESKPGSISENYLWPFFGYSDRTEPDRYHETRYFWPFFVQGAGQSAKGEPHIVNRWGPFYTHSLVKGVDKTWVMWPFWRESTWDDPTVAQSKKQFLWILYWSQEQRSLTNPAAAPASKTHVWPLFSTWDNGAGRKQFQLFSPFEVLFTDNPRVRATWSPLFAIARYDQTAPGDTRTSLLWNLITWKRQDSEQRTEVHVGPLVGVKSDQTEQKVSLFGGLIGMKRAPGETKWRAFWLDFPAKPATASASR